MLYAFSWPFFFRANSNYPPSSPSPENVANQGGPQGFDSGFLSPIRERCNVPKRQCLQGCMQKKSSHPVALAAGVSLNPAAWPPPGLPWCTPSECLFFFGIYSFHSGGRHPWPPCLGSFWRRQRQPSPEKPRIVKDGCGARLSPGCVLWA